MLEIDSSANCYPDYIVVVEEDSFDEHSGYGEFIMRHGSAKTCFMHYRSAYRFDDLDDAKAAMAKAKDASGDTFLAIGITEEEDD